MAALLGRSFVHPLVDYLVIGGGLSLAVTVLVVLYPRRSSIIEWGELPYFILLSNSAHFAASTVRLYTKPGTYQALPLLTSVFPLVAMALLTACMFFAGSIGPHLQALYVTWSPFHYAAQAYGLAVVYAYRSGCQVGPLDKRLLWWTSMLPFFYTLLGARGAGLRWALPEEVLAFSPVDAVLRTVVLVLPYVAFAAVPLLFVRVWRSASAPLPLISVLVLVTNGIWWFVLTAMDAFVWATIFHGLQYLAIVTVFHLKDQMARPDNRHGQAYHVAWFYGACVLLGYGLFSCLPWAYVSAGFGMVESITLVVAAINIHHFIVDAYIWRLRPGDSNRQIVQAGAEA
jgi:hypothetical protein